MNKLGVPFKNLSLYNASMRKGLEDKLFFLEYLPEDNYTFVDFGCADGSVLGALCAMYPNKKGLNTYIGYDISFDMIALAKTNFSGDIDENIIFTSYWKDVQKELKKSNNKKVLILSSVIHEVYSYGEIPKDIDIFWDRVLKTGFDYICIRDMMPSRDIVRKTPISIYNALNQDKNHVLNIGQLAEFEKIHGSTQSMKQAVHFLLKYRWKVNWNREVNENYFPIYVEDLIGTLSLKKYFCDAGTYKIDYLERFQVPYLMECIKNDFGITFEDFTHVKAIFTKNYV